MNREIGSEYYKIYNTKSYFEYLNEINLNKYFVRSGRDAIRLIAQNLENKKILLPSYCCDSMITPFQDLNFEIIYYRIDDKFEIDFDDLYNKLDNNSNCLLMNYFGFNDINLYATKIKEQFSNCNIIFDFTHAIFDIKDLISDYIDYYICSMRKCIPVIESGLVISKNKLYGIEKYIKNAFSLKREKAFEIKQKYIINPFNEELKEEYRRLFFEADSSLDNDKRIIASSKKSIKFLKTIDIEFVTLKRKTNYAYLYKLLKKDYILINECKYTPFMLPVFIKNRDSIQRRLSQKGIFAQVIWPINEQQERCSKESKIHSDTILCIPIDQRYDLYDMNRIFKEINEE